MRNNLINRKLWIIPNFFNEAQNSTNSVFLISTKKNLSLKTLKVGLLKHG
jgi:hypothetical protein